MNIQLFIVELVYNYPLSISQSVSISPWLDLVTKTPPKWLNWWSWTFREFSLRCLVVHLTKIFTWMANTPCYGPLHLYTILLVFLNCLTSIFIHYTNILVIAFLLCIELSINLFSKNAAKWLKTELNIQEIFYLIFRCSFQLPW